MPTGAELAAKLAGAVKEETEASATEEKEVKEKLETVSEETVKADQTSSSEKGKEAKTQKESQAVPYSRFKEVNEKLSDAVREAERATKVENELRQKVAALEQEANVLERIRELAEDDNYRPIVEKLDRKLRGLEEAVEAGTKTEKQADKEAERHIQATRAELEDAFAEQRADLLYQQAYSVAERMLEALPDTYVDADRKVISKNWAPAVDWDAIEEDPSVMREELARSLTEVLTEYGEPRGALQAKIKELETTRSEAGQKTATPSIEDQVKGLIEKDWSKVSVDEQGKVKGATLSDDEFARDMARLMKITRR